jgi:hypothetical protein
MSFRITPEDVGRMARAKNGMAYMVFKGGSDSYPYMTDKGACTSEGKLYYSDGTCGDDLIAWADEPVADQVTDQDRPKDLRDEFAMYALVGLTADPSSGYAYPSAESYENGVSKRAYAIADAMLKARGK